jgi:hypothetical protein
MRPLSPLVPALWLALAIPSFGCGAENGDGSTRAANPNHANPAGIGPAGGASPPPRDSIGGRGRSSDPIKGK